MPLLDNIAGQAVGAGMGMILGNYNDKRQLNQQGKLMEQQIQGQQRMTDYNYAKQLQMWKDTNYSAQVAELDKAGLNKALLYGMSGGGGTTTGSGGGSVQGGSAPTGGQEIQQMMGMGLDLQMKKAQIELAETQAKKNLAEAENLGEGGASRENIKADTVNKILDQVVKEYTGKELKSQFENVKEPYRGNEAQAYSNEQDAKYSIANVLVNLFREGKLYEKGLNEIEQSAITNAKSREETKNIQKQFDILEENLKGVKLDNVIKDLETKLQTQTGIDKNSPTWMKILGRLLVQLLNK